MWIRHIKNHWFFCSNLCDGDLNVFKVRYIYLRLHTVLPRLYPRGTYCFHSGKTRGYKGRGIQARKYGTFETSVIFCFSRRRGSVYCTIFKVNMNGLPANVKTFDVLTCIVRMRKLRHVACMGRKMIDPRINQSI
jgi:hypothetical protein